MFRAVVAFVFGGKGRAERSIHPANSVAATSTLLRRFVPRNDVVVVAQIGGDCIDLLATPFIASRKEGAVGIIHRLSWLLTAGRAIVYQPSPAALRQFVTSGGRGRAKQSLPNIATPRLPIVRTPLGPNVRRIPFATDATVPSARPN
jgi:hypothetical protein